MRKIKFISILLVLSMLLTVPAFAFSTGFTDVSEKATYAEAVSYLADAGILRGTASGRFSPNEKITISQWATMLCRAFDTEPEGTSWQETGTNAVQIAVRSGWLDPTAVWDKNGFICRGELYRTAFAAAGIPLYDATLYGLDWPSSGENALRVGKELGLSAENETAADLVTRAEAAQLLHAVLTQTLTVTPPDTPVTVENLTQWNVNAFLLELRKVPQPILDAFNENGWTFVIGTEYLADLSRKLGVNCIGAAAYTEKRIYVSEASAVLHEFGHFLDCTMGFPHEHSITQRCGTFRNVAYWKRQSGYLSRVRYGTAENAGRTSAPMLNNFTGADKVYIACGYTDLRKGIDGLARLVQQQFELDPFTNTLFLFCGRRRDRIKGLCWEKDGFILLYKRLEQGAYQWPRSESEVKTLTPQQYRWLMEGLQIEQPKAHRPVTGLTTV